MGLRLFTVYGPWGRPDMAYWSFLKAMLNNEPIKIFNYGKNRRDQPYRSSDVVGGPWPLSPRGDLDPYEIINVGNNTPVELMDFVQTLEELAGVPAAKQIDRSPSPEIWKPHTRDIERARNKLGFQPRLRLLEGGPAELRRMVYGPS